MTRFISIVAVGMLIISLTGCGGGGGNGSFIKKVYEGTWTGLATNTANSVQLHMKMVFTYEGDDGFGHELVSFAWSQDPYIDAPFAIGTFIGTAGGLVSIEIQESGYSVDLLGDINGNAFGGGFTMDTPDLDPVTCTFELHR